MACSSCASGGCLTGCSKKGGCSSGGCNRVNTFNWLSDIAAPSYGPTTEFDIVEVSFKQGARKVFYRKPHHVRATTGDFVAVDANGGYDIGHISLSGELVRLQLKRKRVKENAFMPNVLRVANERDMERMAEARGSEKETMVKARAISRSLNLDMKIGDIEIQGDKRKATFFYTADGRVDFRELIRQFAKEFRVRIEMRQIGARQESARLGGIGPCGRELCCSTWLADFKTVGTGAARYQNLAINQSKLSGQCGRLKCCLNYELDAYLDAFRRFPKHADRLQTENGTADLVKTDIFKRLMYYSYRDQPFSKLFALSIESVVEILATNAKGEKAKVPTEDLTNRGRRGGAVGEDVGYADVTGEIELKPLPKNKKKKKKGGGSREGEATPRPEGRGPRPEGQEKRTPRPPRAEGQEPRAPRPPRTDGRGPRPEGKQPHEPRGPRPEGQENREPRPPRSEGQAPREPRPPRTEGQAPREPRPPRPEGQAPREPRAPRTDGRGPRPQGQEPEEPRGPRPEGRGPRPQGQEPREPRPPRPEGQEPRAPKEPRGPRPEGPQPPRNEGGDGDAAKRKKKKRKRGGGGGNRPNNENPKAPPAE